MAQPHMASAVTVMLACCLASEPYSSVNAMLNLISTAHT